LGRHPNAPLTPEGRRRLCERIDAGRPIAHVAAEAGISRQVLSKWYGRWIDEGEEGLQDKSSRPDHSPTATRAEVIRAAEGLRCCPTCNGLGDVGNESGAVCCDDCGGNGLALREDSV